MSDFSLPDHRVCADTEKALTIEVARLTAELAEARTRADVAQKGWEDADKRTGEMIGRAKELGAHVCRMREQILADLPLLRRYVEWSGPIHAGNCPGDDTCACCAKPMHDAVQRMCCLDDALAASGPCPHREQACGLAEVIQWVLGERDDLPERQVGQGLFWWRTELRDRLALVDSHPCPHAAEVERLRKLCGDVADRLVQSDWLCQYTVAVQTLQAEAEKGGGE